MLKIYGRLSSVNVQKAMLCVEELGIPYERVDAGLQFGIVDTPAYRAINPNGLVPTIVDDGFALWESNVIVRYLAASHAAGSLWPNDARRRADADRWMDWQATALQPAMGPAFHGLVRTQADKRDASAIEQSCRKTAVFVATLDKVLADRRFVAGDAYTMGDIALAPAIHRWLHMPVERQPTPHVGRWYADVMARPAAPKVLTLPIT